MKTIAKADTVQNIFKIYNDFFMIQYLLMKDYFDPGWGGGGDVDRKKCNVVQHEFKRVKSRVVVNYLIHFFKCQKLTLSTHYCYQLICFTYFATNI